jgi:type I restriction enzyme S subunit
MKCPWQKVPIKTIYKGFWDGLHATPKKSNDGPIFLGIKNITEDGHLDFSSVRHISERDFPRWTKRVVPQAGDIVFTYEATLHRYAILPEGFRGCLGRRVALIRPDDAKIDTRYLLYYFLGSEWREEVSKHMILGATVDRIPLIEFPDFEIHLPPLPTQQKIAAALSAYDDLIENNTRRIQILEEMAQAIYRQWFVEFKFPRHEDVTRVDSGTELGGIPEGWGAIKLSEIVETQYGYTESAKEKPIGPKFVRGKDINKTSFINWAEVPYCPIDNDDYEKYKLSIGDVLIVRMADPGKVGIIEKEIDAVFASYLIRLKITADLLSPYFLFYTLTADRYQDYITGASTGTTRKSASAPVITDFNMLIPDTEIREHFETMISSIRQMLNVLLEKNANLQATRDLLLPRLVTGKLDVSELEIDI